MVAPFIRARVWGEKSEVNEAQSCPEVLLKIAGCLTRDCQDAPALESLSPRWNHAQCQGTPTEQIPSFSVIFGKACCCLPPPLIVMGGVHPGRRADQAQPLDRLSLLTMPPNLTFPVDVKT